MSASKIKSIIASGAIGISILTMSFVPALAQQTIANVPIVRVGPTTIGGLTDLTRAVVKWIYIIFFIVAVAFILIAAFRYLLAAGDPEKVKGARDMIIYAVVAIVIAFLAVGFETIIGTFLVSPQV